MNTMDPRSDGPLLAAFLERRDEDAFEAVVRRHEALVLSVCGRVLRDEHAARDAAQAVFLVLARKAGSLDLRRPLAPWLHHVAYGTAVSARRERDARRERERNAMTSTTSRPEPEIDPGTLRELIDRELDGLPEKYRRPLILFHFEGKSLAETAAALGSPEGTVGAWLSRGRELLRSKLVRRGAGTLTGAALLAFLSREASASSVGWGFARAAARAAAGGAVPASVVHLAKGALTMLLIAKLKAAALALAAAGVFFAANAAFLAAVPSTPSKAASASGGGPLPLASIAVPALPELPLTFEPFEPEPSVFPASTDLVGHWKFDDEKGSTTAADATGRAPGKLIGGATFAPGKFGGALLVNGKDAYVEIPNTDELDKVQEGSYTLAAWFKPDGVPPGKDADNTANYGILNKTGWHTGFQYSNDKKFTMTHWIATDKPLEPTWVGAGAWDQDYEPGEWYHLAGVVDRAAGTVTLYLNGESKGSGEFAANAATRNYEKSTWKIGLASPGAESYAWPAKGLIDDVRIYGRALTAAEVKGISDGK
ncbi:MAG TPA: sigma-70 family RNA polymerase sigma factor [Planctomycetota bacterium]|nr:sigma-70 family RNA polymerase sigma factor [Planctomycetota bacterium]